MEVRWSALAVEDLERIFRRIEKDNPVAARETVQAIYSGCEALPAFLTAAVLVACADDASWYFLLTLLSIRLKDCVRSKFRASITVRRLAVSEG
jgi:hypothetical protein